MPEERPIEVLVVDDEPAIAEAFRIAIELQSDMAVAGVVSTVGDAVELTRAHAPDVVLMDVRLPDASGIDGTARLKEVDPDVQVILATADLADHVMRDAALAGASGFVAKGTSIADLLDTVRSAARGEMALRPAMLSSVLRQIPRATDRSTSITKQDRVVLDAMAEGLDAAAVGKLLGLSVAEAEARIDDLRKALGARSRLEMLVVAAGAGLLDRLGN